MAQEELIARRYAKGLAKRAAETSQTAVVRKALGLLAAVMDSHSGDLHVPELSDFLTSPKVTLGDKLAAVDGIIAKLGVDQTAGDFFKLLIEHNRVQLLPRIQQAFSEELGKLAGEYTAVVETARPLTTDQKERLAQVLANAFGGVVHVHQRIEPGLLAGARIKVGDRTFDGSVLGKLERLRYRLAACGPEDLARFREDNGESA